MNTIKDVLEAHHRTLRSAAYEVKDQVQARGKGLGLRSKGLYTVSEIALAQPDIAYYQGLVRDPAAWKAFVDRCLLPSEVYSAPATNYEAWPELEASEVIEAASLVETYFRQMDEIHEQFPHCGAGTCGDGDALDMLDNVLSMASNNLDLHFRRTQAQKFDRKAKGLAQSVIWVGLAMAAAIVDQHVVHYDWLSLSHLNSHAPEGAITVAAGWSVQQVIAFFNDRDAKRKVVQEQTELESAIKAATVHAGNDIGRRCERLLRLMEGCISEGKSAKQRAIARGNVQEAAEEVAKWLRIFEFLRLRFTRLHAYVRASTPLIDICFKATLNEANRNDVLIPFQDNFYGIPRAHLRNAWFVTNGAVVAIFAALFGVTHHAVDLSNDFGGAVFGAAVAAAAGSFVASIWRTKKVSADLHAPISPEFVQSLSANIVQNLPRGRDTVRTNAMERRLTALKDNADVMIQGFAPGTFNRPIRPSTEFDNDDLI